MEENTKSGAGVRAGFIPARRLRGAVKFRRYNAPQPNGEHAVLRAFKLMHELGLLQNVVPELLQGENVAQNPKYHAYDVMNHAFRVTASTPPDLVLRLAGMLHDIAKPEMVEKTGRMYNHETVGADLAREILTRLKAESRHRQGVRPDSLAYTI